MRKRRDAGCDRRRSAARRAAGGVRLRPWVVRPAAQIVDRVEPEAESRRIGAADDDRAGALPVGDDRAVRLGDDVLEADDAVGGRATLLVDVLLDRHRYAVQRAQGVTVRDCAIGAFRCGARHIRQIDGHRVERRVDGRHARQARLQRILGGDLVFANRRRDAHRAPAPDFIHHHLQDARVLVVSAPD
jgi:hypothetical protein